MSDFPGMGRWVESRELLGVTSTLLIAFGLPQIGADSIPELQTTVKTLTRHIDENPDSASDYQSRGIAYFELGEFEKSISDFDRFMVTYMTHIILRFLAITSINSHYFRVLFVCQLCLFGLHV